jgi:hypothetical protein
MRCVIRVPVQVWQAVRAWLLAVPEERMAYLLARASVFTDPWDGPTVDLLARSALLIPDAALVAQSVVRVEVDPQFTRAVLVSCYETGLSLIDIHTHPFAAGRVWFSGTDLHNMRVTHAEFRAEIPQDPPAAAASLVLGRNSVAAAWLPPDRAELEPVTAMRVLGGRSEEVALCSR